MFGKIFRLIFELSGIMKKYLFEKISDHIIGQFSIKENGVSSSNEVISPQIFFFFRKEGYENFFIFCQMTLLLNINFLSSKQNIKPKIYRQIMKQ